MKRKYSLSRIVLMTTSGFLASVALSFVYYLIFSIFFSSDVEKKLISENRVLSEELPAVENSVNLLRDELVYLEDKDNKIYRQIFNTDAPRLEGVLDEEMFSKNDFDVSGGLVARSAALSERAASKAQKVEDDWERIFECLNDKDRQLPPLSSPVKKLSFTNVGASVGEKVNPFYKLKVKHEGLDIVASPGTPVYASCGGVVARAAAEGKKGNVVEITHQGGYVTRYAHLSKISVKRGQRVKTGTEIGLVGDSGRSFVAHLHYEVLKDGLAVDPVDCLFASADPDEYLGMMVMGALSAQSMD